MTPEQLQDEVREAGLVVLAVCPHRSDPNMAVVYLNGNAGQWVDGYALGIIRSMPGVARVAEHVRTPAIILVWME